MFLKQHKHFLTLVDLRLVMNSKQVFVMVLFAILSALAVCYFSDHNREVLLLGVYPAIAFGLLGLFAWWEND